MSPSSDCDLGCFRGCWKVILLARIWTLLGWIQDHFVGAADTHFLEPQIEGLHLTHGFNSTFLHSSKIQSCDGNLHVMREWQWFISLQVHQDWRVGEKLWKQIPIVGKSRYHKNSILPRAKWGLCFFPPCSELSLFWNRNPFLFPFTSLPFSALV